MKARSILPVDTNRTSPFTVPDVYFAREKDFLRHRAHPHERGKIFRDRDSTPGGYALRLRSYCIIYIFSHPYTMIIARNKDTFNMYEQRKERPLIVSSKKATLYAIFNGCMQRRYIRHTRILPGNRFFFLHGR